MEKCSGENIVVNEYFIDSIFNFPQIGEMECVLMSGDLKYLVGDYGDVKIVKKL